MIVFLILGDVFFQDWEVPESIRGIGGSQSLAAHKFVGGRRTIDALGADDDELSWSGRFRGPLAEFRCRKLDRMRKQGAQVKLAWGGFRYQVLISRFQVEYQNPREIPYSISCMIVQDEAAPNLAIVSKIEEILGDALNYVLTLGGLIDIADITSALGDISDRMSTVQSYADAATDVLSSIADAINTAQGVVGGFIESFESIVEPAESAFGMLSGGSPFDLVDGLLGQAQAFSQLGNLYSLSSELTNMGKNLVSIGP